MNGNTQRKLAVKTWRESKPELLRSARVMSSGFCATTPRTPSVEVWAGAVDEKLNNAATATSAATALDLILEVSNIISYPSLENGAPASSRAGFTARPAREDAGAPPDFHSFRVSRRHMNAPVKTEKNRAADELQFGQPPAVADMSSEFSSPGRAPLLPA